MGVTDFVAQTAYHAARDLGRDMNVEVYSKLGLKVLEQYLGFRLRLGQPKQ